MSLLSIVASSSAFLLPSSPPPKASSIDSDWSIKNKKQPGVLRLISAWYAMVSLQRFHGERGAVDSVPFSLRSLRSFTSSYTPRGNPLYPVASSKPSADTVTAPTRQSGFFDFRATVMAISRKYSSQSAMWRGGAEPPRMQGVEEAPLAALASGLPAIAGTRTRQM